MPMPLDWWAAGNPRWWLGALVGSYQYHLRQENSINPLPALLAATYVSTSPGSRARTNDGRARRRAGVRLTHGKLGKFQEWGSSSYYGGKCWDKGDSGGISVKFARRYSEKRKDANSFIECEGFHHQLAISIAFQGWHEKLTSKHSNLAWVPSWFQQHLSQLQSNHSQWSWSTNAIVKIKSRNWMFILWTRFKTFTKLIDQFLILILRDHPLLVLTMAESQKVIMLNWRERPQQRDILTRIQSKVIQRVHRHNPARILSRNKVWSTLTASKVSRLIIKSVNL